MAETKVILVTAGSAGLGATVSRLFAKHGYRVVFNYANNTDRAQKLLEELSVISTQSEARPELHKAIQADLASQDDVKRLVKETMSSMGRIDVVLSNGGWSKFADMTSLDDNISEEVWDRAYAMNVKSHLWLLHAARPALDESYGAFITTASVAGINNTGSSLAYCVTKAAQIQMVKALARMVGPRIRVNTVSPGLLITEWAERFSETQKETHRQKTALKRFAELEDVAEQVLSISKSSSMTGVNVVVDAGYIL